MKRRNERTSELIKREISRLLEREINDPRLSKLISVTEVSVSPDLKYAKVFVSVLGKENKEEVLAGFKIASGFLRRKLVSHLSLRYAPELTFCYDDSIERGSRLLELMGQIEESQ